MAWHRHSRFSIASVALAALAAGCGGSSSDPTKTATELAEGLLAATEIASQDPQPILCARMSKQANPPALSESILADGSTVSLRGDRLAIVLAKGREARIAVIADARGKSRVVSESLESLTKAWDAENVAVVVALGGMAETEKELTETFSKLATPDRIVVAMPGNRERVAGLRASVDALRKRGLPVFAGTDVRLLSFAGATIALLPGVGSQSSLVSGGDGCLHREEDAAALAAQLVLEKPPRLWFSYAAPRQHHSSDSPSDLSEGVHAGERILTTAIEQAKPQAVFHGQIAPRPSADMKGVVRVEATDPTMVSVGAIEELPTLIGRGEAIGNGVIVTIGEKSIAWSRTHRVAPPKRSND